MRLLRGFLATLGVGGAAWLLLAWLVDRAGVRAEDMYRISGQDVVVVLGARVNEDGSPSPTLRSRVEHAVKVLRKMPGAVMLFSGGVGDHGASEATVARDLALALGVAPQRCLVEEASHSTAQNALFSVRLLRERYPRGFHVTLVSDPYHLPRARLLFQRLQGNTVSTSPVLDAPRHREWAARVGWAMREVPALVKDALLTSPSS